MRAGIDVSRSMSGGGKAHIIGIISKGDPEKYGIVEVHVWGVSSLLAQLPEKPWLKKHEHRFIEKSLLHQIYWQKFILPKELQATDCDILLSTSAGTSYVHDKSVVMSRNMLPFEKAEVARYQFFSYNRLRLFLLRYAQIKSLKKATAVLFLTEYAAKSIQTWTGKIVNYRVIPHGVTDRFKNMYKEQRQPLNIVRAIRCIYVSNTAMYKHQWNVALAIDQLRKNGYNLEITFVGGGHGQSKKMLDKTLAKIDPESSFCKQLPFVLNEKLPNLLADSDIYIFASSCENMPNTLLEGMAVGLPIASSDMGPMPEVLKDGGIYFQPEDVNSIVKALEKLLVDSLLREKLAKKAKQISNQYSWGRCADETFSFLADVSKKGKY